MTNKIVFILSICVLSIGCTKLPVIKDNLISWSNKKDQVKFKLIDSESEKSLKNIALRIPDYKKISKNKPDKRNKITCGFGKINNENTKVVKTNEDGIFYMPDKSLDNKFGANILIPEINSSLTYSVSQKKLTSRIYRKGFGRVQVIGRNIYYLDSAFVEKIRYYDDTKSVESFDEFELFPISLNYRPKDIISNLDKDYYSQNHLELWEYLWQDFENIVGDDILKHPNTEIWNQYVFRVFNYLKDVNVNPLIEIYKGTTSTEKKYNILHAIIKVRDFRIRRNKEVILSEEKIVKALFDEFYVEKSDFISRISNFPRVGDYLKKELIRNEKMYYSYNNANNFPNVKDRLKLVSN